MPDLAQLNLVIDSSQVDQANRRLHLLITVTQRAERGADGLTDKFNKQKSAGDKLSSTYSKMLGLLGRLAAGFTATGAVIGALKASADFEYVRIGMEGLIGDTERAAAILKDLEQFAATTPFQFQGLAENARLMMALGFEAEKVVPIMRILGDAAAGLGQGEEGIHRIALALGQMQAKGKVAGEEMRQLTEAGIPAWDILADAIGVSVPEAMELVEKRMLDVDQAINAILKGMQERFAGQTERLAQTTKGLFATIKDTVWFTMRDVGDAIIEAFDVKEGMRNVIVWIGEFGAVVVDVVRVLAGLDPKLEENREKAESLAKIIKLLAAFFAIIITLKVATFFYNMAGGVMAAANAALHLQGTLWPLLAVLTAIMSYEIGSYLYDEFKIVQEVGQGAVSTLWRGWERLKAGVLIVIEAIKFAWENAVYFIKQRFADLFDVVSKGADAYDSVMSFFGNQTNAGRRIAQFAKQFRQDIQADAPTPLKERTEKIIKERDEALALIDKVDIEVQEAINREFGDADRKGGSFTDHMLKDITKALDAVKGVVGGLAPDFTTLTAAANEAEKAIDGALKIEVDRDKLVKPAEDSAQAMEKLAKAREKAAQELQDMFDALDLEYQLIGKTNDERERAENLIKLQNLAQQAGIETQKELNALTDAYIEKLEKVQKRRELQEIADAAGESMARAFEDAIIQGERLQDVIRGLYQDLTRLVFRQTVTQPLANAFSGMFTSWFGGASAMGNVFERGNVVPFADGGIVTGPTLFPMSRGRVGLMGEAGAEAIIPLERDSRGRLGVSGGSTVTNNYVTMNISTPNASSFRESKAQVQRIAAAMLSRT